jgi:hypothetical protein
VPLGTKQHNKRHPIDFYHTLVSSSLSGIILFQKNLRNLRIL